jgi:predicted nucleic acid-binding protein
MAEADEPLPPLVYFDADVIVSGCRSTVGASHVLLRIAEYGLIRPMTSELAIEEAERHIKSVSASAAEAFSAAVRDVFATPVPAPTIAEVEAVKEQADPKDVAHLAAALAHGASYLVTFNVRDYRPAAGSLIVLRPGDLIDRLRTLIAAGRA